METASAGGDLSCELSAAPAEAEDISYRGIYLNLSWMADVLSQLLGMRYGMRCYRNAAVEREGWELAMDVVPSVL